VSDNFHKVLTVLAWIFLAVLNVTLLNQVIEAKVENVRLKSEMAEERLKMYEQVRTFAKVASTADHYLLLIKAQERRAEENANRIQEMAMKMKEER
jgi:hypothetical protein